MSTPRIEKGGFTTAVIEELTISLGRTFSQRIELKRGLGGLGGLEYTAIRKRELT